VGQGQRCRTRKIALRTNDDVDTLDPALRDVRKGRGELGPDHMLPTAHGRHNFAVGDRIQFTANDKPAGITNGHTATIEAIDGTHLAVRLDGPQPKTINFDAAAFDEFRHGYAGTIYRGQGKTLDLTYLYHSEHWRSAASYVALTRHRDKAELFVARNTAKDLETLARQMARTDERRAASMFYPLDKLDPVRPMTPNELNACFAPDDAWRTRQKHEPLIFHNQPPHEPTPACAPQQFEYSSYDYYPGLTRGDEERERTRSR
jgi:hypothetical protein